MSISSYSDLKTEWQKWTSDTTTTLSDRFDNLTTILEARMHWGAEQPNPFPSPPLRARQMEQRATATANDEYLALPTDYLEMIYLKVNGSPDTFLDPMTPIQATRSTSNDTDSDLKYFTVAAGELKFSPAPASSVTVEMLYYKFIPGLVANLSNWLLTAAPNVYLYGGLLEIYLFKGAMDRAAYFHGLYSGSLHSLDAAQKLSRAGGTLIQRPEGATP